MKYVVAVSGGVDSVVLLDMMVKKGDDILVAHVSHGIRDDSTDDARFVKGLARLYGLKYIETSLNLGEDASEELARNKRYDFLVGAAKKYSRTLVTAHHGDDLLETVAINIQRGTGWRGLCVLGRAGVKRPLLQFSKQQIYNYALQYKLEYVEDKTNRDTKYLRNRTRATLHNKTTDAIRCDMYNLRKHQLELRQQIDECASLAINHNYDSRYFFTQIPNEIAIELLGYVLHSKTGLRPVRAQLAQALLAVKTSKPGTSVHVGSRILLRFTSRAFSVEMLQ